MIKPLTLSQRLLERADASDEDCRTDDGDIMREADDALKAAAAENSRLREALEPFALMYSEGVSKGDGYCTVTTQADYFRRAANAIGEKANG